MTGLDPTRQQRGQRQRLQRVTLAIAVSLLTVVMTLLIASVGYIPARPALIYAVVVATLCLVTYAAVRSSRDTRFPEPSLTVALLVTAGLSISYVAYEGAAARPAFMAMYLMAYMFGIFGLGVRGLVWTAIFYVGCYGGVVGLSLLLRPETTDIRREMLRIVGLGFLLGWMAIFGSYIGTLRQSLRQANSDLRRALERAELLASEDPLTGCYNRRRVMEFLAVEINRAGRGSALSVCLIDIDDFKAVNDTYGHHAGDETLKELANVAQTMLRRTDVLGRYGGDEFLIGLSQTARADALRVAERVRRTVEQRAFVRLPESRRVTLSIGVAEYRPSDTLDRLLSEADIALYEAKREGRNRVVAAR